MGAMVQWLLAVVPLLMLQALLGCTEAAGPEVQESVFGYPCRLLDCSAGGVCVHDALGEASCLCEVGYAGVACERCEAGFARDPDGHCVHRSGCSARVVAACGEHGECMVRDGHVGCSCDAGYAGPRCNLCTEELARAERAVDTCIWLELAPSAADPDPNDLAGVVPPPVVLGAGPETAVLVD
jgi:hypothetical protein